MHPKDTEFLERDRIPERRMHFIQGTPVTLGRGVINPEFERIYREAQAIDPWPTSDDKPVGFDKNPWKRETKNVTLCAIILKDPYRRGEAFEKMIEAGWTERNAHDVLRRHGRS